MRLIHLILLFFSFAVYFSSSDSFAQDYPVCGSNPLVCTKEKAYTALVLPANIKQVCESIYGVDPSYTSGSVKNIVDGYSGGSKAFMGDYKCTYTFPGNPPSTINGTSIVRYYMSDCPVGTEWFESLGKCDKPCSQRNADLGGVNQPIRWSESSADQCKSECIYKIVSDFQTRNVYVTSGGQSALAGTRYGGIWEYTGDRCPIDHSEPKDEPPKPQCTPATHGQTYCITPDNKECYSASTGRTICWGPSEQGTKTDGPTIQEHKQGQQTPSAPPNTTYNSTTTVTTNISNNSSQTTTNNYTTNNNAPAGPSNNGEPANNNGEPTTPYNPYPGGNNGSGTGNSGNSTNGDKNASSGGGDCASAPVSSGDQILGQIAYQTWATRCNVEKGKLEGAGDCTDIGTVVGFSCTGDPVGCKQALEAKEANCKTWAADKNGNGQPDWTEGDPPSDNTGNGEGNGDGPPIKENTYSMSDLNTSDIFGGGTCPSFTITIWGATASTADIPAWCTIVSIMRAAVLLMAAFMAARILMGGN